MWKRLITGLILISSAFPEVTGQNPDGYDTLFTRGSKYILVPKYDTIKQLEQVDIKADSILNDLAEIMEKLNIKDTVK